MNKVDHIVVVSGWEERFLLGLRHDISIYKPSSILLFTFEEYAEMTRENREALHRLCTEAGITVIESTLRRLPKEVWSSLREGLQGLNLHGKKVLLDISTMPREVIWWSLKFLQGLASEIRFIYHRPLKYASDWLTRDTGEPRLVYQFSGVARLGQPTALLLLSGFDIDRVKRMILYFEPATVLLGIQGGAQFGNDEKNILPAQEMSDRMPRVKSFDMDAYSEDRGFGALLGAIQPHIQDHNIIAASLGPKVSGISLFQLQGTYPEIALAYAPSRQFNRHYSEGMGSSVEGVVSDAVIAADSLISVEKIASQDSRGENIPRSSAVVVSTDIPSA